VLYSVGAALAGLDREGPAAPFHERDAEVQCDAVGETDPAHLVAVLRLRRVGRMLVATSFGRQHGIHGGVLTRRGSVLDGAGTATRSPKAPAMPSLWGRGFESVTTA
jgi:hypothetical protein